MLKRQRDDIRNARTFYRNFVFQYYSGTLEEKETLYNRLIKAYLRGYYEAIKNVTEMVPLYSESTNR